MNILTIPSSAILVLSSWLMPLSSTAAGNNTLYVVHSHFCPHCVKWLNEVYAKHKDLAKSFHKQELPNIVLKDAAKEADRADVEKMITEHKIKPVSGVPAFIVLKDGVEKEGCRVTGYSNDKEWFEKISDTIDKCQ